MDSKSTDELRGQTALVTGASSGLGKRFAQVLASQGAGVALVGRREDRLAEVAELIRADGGTAEPVTLDMRQPDQFEPALDHIQNRLGPVSILINNAGVPDGTYAVRLSPARMDQVIETNMRGPFALACRVAERLIEREAPGRVVNIASMLAFDYSPTSAAALYSMTKSSVIRMTEVLALEWARFHINVNAIAPGLFESEMTSAMMERVDEAAVLQSFPRKRMGKPEYLDGALRFLVGPASEFITGTIIKADDGQSRR